MLAPNESADIKVPTPDKSKLCDKNPHERQRKGEYGHSLSPRLNLPVFCRNASTVSIAAMKNIQSQLTSGVSGQQLPVASAVELVAKMRLGYIASVIRRLMSALSFAVIVTQAVGQAVPSHRVANVLGEGYFAGNQIRGSAPAGYLDLLVLWVDYTSTPRSSFDPAKMKQALQRSLYPDAEGRIPVRGRIVFKGPTYPNGDGASKYLSYEFSKGYLVDLPGKPVALVFDTVPVNGVSYHFEGQYSAREKNSDAPVHLQGIMRKRVGDHTSPNVNLRFNPFNIVQ